MKRNVVKKWLRVSSNEDISVEAGRMAIDNKRLQMIDDGPAKHHEAGPPKARGYVLRTGSHTHTDPRHDVMPSALWDVHIAMRLGLGMPGIASPSTDSRTTWKVCSHTHPPPRAGKQAKQKEVDPQRALGQTSDHARSSCKKTKINGPGGYSVLTFRRGSVRKGVALEASSDSFRS